MQLLATILGTAAPGYDDPNPLARSTGQGQAMIGDDAAEEHAAVYIQSRVRGRAARHEWQQQQYAHTRDLPLRVSYGSFLTDGL